MQCKQEETIMAIKITGFYQLPHQTMPELVDFR